MRLRQKGEFTTPPNMEEQRTWATCAESAWVVDYSEVPSKLGKVITFEDVVTPQWFRKKRKGETVFNPMKKVEREVFHSSIGYVIKESGVGQNCDGVLRRVTYRSNEQTLPILLKRALSLGSDGTIAVPSSTIVTTDDIARLVSEAATKVKSKIRTGDAGGWETIAEFSKTIKLLKHPFEGITKLTKTLKGFSVRDGSKGVRSGADLLAVPASEWLKYRYGVLPLINDIKAVLKTLNSKSKGKIRKTERSTARLSGVTNRELVSNFGVLETTFLENRRHEVKVRAMSLDEYIQDSQTDLGLTLDQIPKTVWDLIPFSFVVDWFANVSDFINASIPRPGVTNLCSGYTIEEKLISSYFVKGSRVTSASYVLDQPPGGAYVERLITKKRVVGLPGPALVVKSDFRFDDNTRLADSAGLITQQLRGLVVR